MTARSNNHDLGLVAVAPALAVAGAVAAFVVLSGLAKPAHYTERTRVLNDELAQAQSLLHAPGDAGAYPVKALCQTSPDQAALDLRQRLQSQSAAGSVAVADITATPQAGDTLEKVTPVTLQFTASGRYEQVIGLLGTLAKSQPQIFADNVDLRPDANNVRLKFTGRVFCSNSARP